MGRLTRGLLAGALGLLLPVAAAGQGRLLSAELRAELEPDAGATVRIVYTVAPRTAARVELAVVRFTDSDITEPVVTVAGQRAAVSAMDLGSGRDRYVVVIPPEQRQTERLDITVAYRVGTATVTDRVRLPVLAVTWPPVAAAAGLFRAIVTLPAGRVAFDAFPSEFRVADDVLSTSLHVVPALVSFGMAGDAPWPDVATLTELFVLALLSGIGWIGWQRFRAEMR